MCGIVGYTGDSQAWPILLEGIEKLEYRGYDSAGIAVISEGALQISKRMGEIEVLRNSVEPISGNYGISHTRWATHGKPSENNAHPFTDCSGKLALVHNGIIENFQSLKDGLLERGHTFSSETDSEIIVHLLEEKIDKDPLEALREVVSMLDGSYAIVMVHSDFPGIVYGARDQSPLVVGVSTGEGLLASDVTPLLKYTQKVVFMEDGDLVTIRPDGFDIVNVDGVPQDREITKIEWRMDDAEKGGYKHFMLKEIHEVPQAIRESIRGRVQKEATSATLMGARSIKLVACGTSYHAGLVGKYIMEELVGIPTTTEFASEYRYAAGGHERPLIILLSQSGETADTLAAAHEAKRRGCPTIAVTNVVGSTLARHSDKVVYTRAGPEIGVAATKTWITQIVALVLIALELGIETGEMSPKLAEEYRKGLRGLPRKVYNILDREDEFIDLADNIKDSENMFFIGRNISFPTALEGALKMKEISYIHAEGYAAGELKHGPLALLTKDTPVVAIVPGDSMYPKMISNIKEVAAREAPILTFGEEGDADIAKVSDWSLLLPKVDPIFSSVTFGVALQLLSYHVADKRGCSIDKPRNLAKSVTVE